DRRDRLPGPARRLFRPRLPRRLPRLDHPALPELRGGDGCGARRPGGARHAALRELARRARAGHPPAAAGKRPLGGGRAFRAGGALPACPAWRDARHAAAGAQPPGRARPGAEHPEGARPHPGDRGGYGGCRADHRRTGRHRGCGDCQRARRRDLRAQHPPAQCRGCGAQHHALLCLLPDAEGAGGGDAGLRHHLRLPRAQHPGGALQGAGGLRHQRREHDQARELHAGRRVHRHAVPRRCRRPSGGGAGAAGAGGAGLLLAGAEAARHLSGAPLPAGASGRGGV
ncbi:MAG: Prephenate dehydratase, partial [uncultured Craurococcus sp.]